MNDIDTTPIPQGDLALQTVAMPKDTNASGDIFGGWLLSQMDIAGMVTASDVAGGRVATVAIDGMAFLTPVHVGAVFVFNPIYSNETIALNDKTDNTFAIRA